MRCMSGAGTGHIWVCGTKRISHDARAEWTRAIGRFNDLLDDHLDITSDHDGTRKPNNDVHVADHHIDDP